MPYNVAAHTIYCVPSPLCRCSVDIENAHCIHATFKESCFDSITAIPAGRSWSAGRVCKKALHRSNMMGCLHILPFQFALDWAHPRPEPGSMLAERSGAALDGCSCRELMGSCNSDAASQARWSLSHLCVMQAICKEADILVAAIGRAEFVPGSWIKPSAVVIDVGMNDVEVSLAARSAPSENPKSFKKSFAALSLAV